MLLLGGMWVVVGLGFGAWGHVDCCGFRVWGLGFRVQSLELWVQGLEGL